MKKSTFTNKSLPTTATIVEQKANGGIFNQSATSEKLPITTQLINNSVGSENQSDDLLRQIENLQKLLTQKNKTIDDLTLEKELVIKNISQQHQFEIKELKLGHNNEIGQLKQQNLFLKNEIDNYKIRYEDQKLLTEQYKQEVRDLNDSHRQELRDLNENYHNQIRDLNNNHRQELEAINVQQYRDEIRALNENYRQEIRELNENYRQEIRDLKVDKLELREDKARYIDKVRILESDQAIKEQKLQELQNIIIDLKKNIVENHNMFNFDNQHITHSILLNDEPSANINLVGMNQESLDLSNL